MSSLLRFIAATLALLLAGSVHGSAVGSHNFFLPIDPEWEAGGFSYGCELYNYIWTENDSPDTFMVNECYVDAPSGSNVTSFGVDFSASGTAHWSGQSASSSGFANSGVWTYTGAAQEYKQILLRIANTTEGVRYWDYHNFVFNFWYIVPATAPARTYIQYGSANQTDRRGL